MSQAPVPAEKSLLNFNLDMDPEGDPSYAQGCSYVDDVAILVVADPQFIIEMLAALVSSIVYIFNCTPLG